MVSVAPSRVAASRIVPPSTSWAMPWTTAFSTSGCSSSGGTRQSAACRIGLARDLQPCAEPHLLDGEEAFGQRQLVGRA